MISYFGCFVHDIYILFQLLKSTFSYDKTQQLFFISSNLSNVSGQSLRLTIKINFLLNYCQSPCIKIEEKQLAHNTRHLNTIEHITSSFNKNKCPSPFNLSSNNCLKFTLQETVIIITSDRISISTEYFFKVTACNYS